MTGSHGDGIPVAIGQSFLEQTDGQLTAWCWYDLKKNQDTPGDWIFQFFLDEKKVVDRKFMVW